MDRESVFYPGDLVAVYDYTMFIDDDRTPFHMLLKEATVIRHYGERHPQYGDYPSLIDVQFHHRPHRVSRGHFDAILMQRAH